MALSIKKSKDAQPLFRRSKPAKFSVHRKFISCGEKIFFLWGENLFSVHRKFSRCGQEILPVFGQRISVIANATMPLQTHSI
jgi:hypothetical protein